MVRDALKKNHDILLLEGLPLFSKGKTKTQEKIQSGVISTALSAKAGKEAVVKV